MMISLMPLSLRNRHHLNAADTDTAENRAIADSVSSVSSHSLQQKMRNAGASARSIYPRTPQAAITDQKSLSTRWPTVEFQIPVDGVRLPSPGVDGL